MLVNFQKVKVRNFFSVGSVPVVVEYNKAPTTLVSGKNGASKSACVLDSINFALFGSPYRKINIPQIVNSINSKECEVELWFTVGKKEYRIFRSIKPNKFEIYENDKLIDQSAAKKDYQKYLEENILGGLNEKVFRQIVVIGSADYTPFMQLTAAARREVIEELLDIKIFSQMLKIAKEKMDSMKETVREMDYQVDLLQEKINLQQNNRKKLREENKQRKAQLNVKVDEEQDKIKSIQSVIEGLQTKKTTMHQHLLGRPMVEKTLSEAQALNSNFSATLKNVNALESFFKSNDICPTCKQNIDSNHKEHINNQNNEKLAKVNDSLTKLKVIINEKSENLAKYVKLQKEVDKLDKEVYNKQNDVSMCQKLISKYQEEIESLGQNNNIDEVNNNLKVLDDDMEKLKTRRNDLLTDRTYYEIVSNMLRDGGIKTKIIKQYIPMMNKIINEYLLRFGLPVEFTLDEQFNEVVKSRYRDEFQYNNFSEGEKSRIDLSLLLAWRSIAKSKNTTNTNLLILDETFDSSLDQQATDELLDILLQMDKQTNIFIISHKTDLSDKLHNSLVFEKVGNFSRIAV